METPKISATEFDARFDAGEDMSDYIDWSSAQRPGLDPQPVELECPEWMVARLDREAKRRGVSRQALIRMWLTDRLDAAA
ncbi:MAG: type II toxin-antitoxin system BrnA family antitoxin [Sphingomonadaceae bacterium]